ncbi:putative serine C-palmitoyltransferase [Lupinus albus]|uniref:Putative serine C-palmitoyltransferase n=1 Tax=Lupinus albus TaxID=3870 RepID=A0A6A4N055_LUPAL|nr:putative serine C-palmitoyltransferase [Lupinus albus]
MNCSLFCFLRTLIRDTLATSGLSNITGFTIASNPESPIVYLRLEKSTGSTKDDLRLLENIAHLIRFFI